MRETLRLFETPPRYALDTVRYRLTPPRMPGQRAGHALGSALVWIQMRARAEVRRYKHGESADTRLGLLVSHLNPYYVLCQPPAGYCAVPLQSRHLKSLGRCWACFQCWSEHPH